MTDRGNYLKNLTEIQELNRGVARIFSEGRTIFQIQ